MISVVIPCFNGGEVLNRCLRSLVGTEAPGRLEVVLRDDASPEPMGLEGVEEGFEIRTSRNSENLGFVQTANLGATEAKGEILLFLNQDTEFLSPGWGERLEELFRERPDIGVVGAKLIYPDSRLVQFAGGFLDEEEWRSDYLYYRARGDEPGTNRGREVDWVLGAFLAIRGDLFRSLGGFSPAYHSSYEDIDLCLRVAERGYRVFYEPNIRLFHYETQTGLTGLHQSESLSTFRDRWSGRLMGAQPDYYGQDGLSSSFVKRMMSLFQRDYYNVSRVVETFGLEEPTAQRTFVEGRSSFSILDQLVEHFRCAGSSALPDFLYYRGKVRLRSGTPEDFLSDFLEVLSKGEPSLKRDESLLLLRMMGQPVEPSGEPFSQRLSTLSRLVEEIGEGLPWPGKGDILEQALLLKFTDTVSWAVRRIPAERLSRYVAFIEEREGWFSNKASLINLFFSLGERDFEGRGGEFFRRAVEWTREGRWDRVKRAQFAINQASYWEKRGEYQRSLGLLEEVEEPLPRSLGSSLHYHLGECFHRLGDEGKALSYWTKALRGNPDNALLRKKWKELARDE